MIEQIKNGFKNCLFLIANIESTIPQPTAMPQAAIPYLKISRTERE